MVGATQAAAKRQKYEEIGGSTTDNTRTENNWSIRKHSSILYIDINVPEKPPSYDAVAFDGPRSRFQLVIVNDRSRLFSEFSLLIDLFQSLLKYMIPLTLVYFAEYLINQGLVSMNLQQFDKLRFCISMTGLNWLSKYNIFIFCFL